MRIGNERLPGRIPIMRYGQKHRGHCPRPKKLEGSFLRAKMALFHTSRNRETQRKDPRPAHLVEAGLQSTFHAVTCRASSSKTIATRIRCLPCGVSPYFLSRIWSEAC